MLPEPSDSRSPRGTAVLREPLPDGSAAGAAGVLLRGKFCATGQGGGRAAPRGFDSPVLYSVNENLFHIVHGRAVRWLK